MFTLSSKCLQSRCQLAIILLCGGVIPVFLLMVSLKYGSINLMSNFIKVLIWLVVVELYYFNSTCCFLSFLNGHKYLSLIIVLSLHVKSGVK